MTLSVRCLHNLFLYCLLFLLSFSSVSATYIKKEIDPEREGRPQDASDNNSDLDPQKDGRPKDVSNNDSDLQKEGRPQEVNKNVLFVPNQAIAPIQTQYSRETQLLKEEVVKLRQEVEGQKELLQQQKDLTSNLLQRTTDLLNKQDRLIGDLSDTTKIILDISNITRTISTQQTTYKDAFVLNKEGKPVAFVDTGLRLYEYGGGNLLGWIKPDTNEIIRSYDNSVVAVVENDFVIDETGYPVGSIERSETLKWDREKLYGKVQKTPASHFFIRPQNPRQFILSPFRSSDWSPNKKLEDILYFSEKNIQKVK